MIIPNARHESDIQWKSNLMRHQIEFCKFLSSIAIWKILAGVHIYSFIIACVAFWGYKFVNIFRYFPSLSFNFLYNFNATLSHSICNNKSVFFSFFLERGWNNFRFYFQSLISALLLVTRVVQLRVIVSFPAMMMGNYMWILWIWSGNTIK